METKETHIYIGMFRPAWDVIALGNLANLTKDRGLRCPGCDMLLDDVCGADKNKIALPWLRKCWQDGHFDTPVYKPIEELERAEL